ncbi:MAG: hypothetical protein P8Y68_20080 [Anaerolineales bacterium]|jgi:hypothetical protein
MARDLRKYAKNTTVQSVIGFVVILLFVGDGLIYALYGQGAAISGLLCILGGMLPILLIFGLLSLLDIIVRRANEE